MIELTFDLSDPTSPPALDDREAHVWIGCLDVDDAEVARLESTLCPEERARAAKMALTVVRRRFSTGRGVLREILARYCGVRAREVTFVYGPHGKPALSDDAGVRFSVSHSADVVAVAVHRELDIGVDVERLRPVSNHRHLAKRFFAPSEYAALTALSGRAADEAFLRCWTRKEACAKVLGEPLVPLLRRLEVEVNPTTPARLVSVDSDRAAAASWSLEDFEPSPGFVGALAVRREPAAPFGTTMPDER
jgi:4'-phosphopantetheinyl transferase